MQDVELTDDAPDGVHESSPTPEATARVRRWRRRLIAGTAVLALALGVAQWVVTARENAALDRLAQIPGVLSPVDESFGILRRVASVDDGSLPGLILTYDTSLHGADTRLTRQSAEPGTSTATRSIRRSGISHSAATATYRTYDSGVHTNAAPMPSA